MGGGTFWGIGSLLAKINDFDQLLEVAEKGDHTRVDMLVDDIYGGGYDSLGLSGDVIASSFGKAARQPGKELHLTGNDVYADFLCLLPLCNQRKSWMVPRQVPRAVFASKTS